MDCQEISARRKIDDKSDDLDFGTDLSIARQAASVENTDVKATVSSEKISARSKIDKSDDLDFGIDLPITKQAASVENTDVKATASAEEENQNSKTTDTNIHSKPTTVESMESSEAVESPQGPRIKTSRTHTMSLQPQSVNTSPVKASCPMVEEIAKPCLSNEPAAPSPLHASETAHTVANRETSPDFHGI